MRLQPVFTSCETVGGTVAGAFFALGLCLPSGLHFTENDLERYDGEDVEVPGADRIDFLTRLLTPLAEIRRRFKPGLTREGW